MITIICAKGLIDATECKVYITKAEGYTSLSGDISIPGDGYNLKITSLDKEKNIDFVIMQFPDKRKAEFVYQHIVNAVRAGEECVDIRDFEKEEQSPIR